LTKSTPFVVSLSNHEQRNEKRQLFKQWRDAAVSQQQGQEKQKQPEPADATASRHEDMN